MMRVLNLLSLLLVAALATAQNDTTALKAKCNLCFDGSHTGSSPYDIRFRKELPYFAVGAIISGLAAYTEFNNTVAPYTEDELLSLKQGNINSLDRNAVDNWSPRADMASNILISTATFLPVLFITNHHTRSDLIPLTLMGVEALMINFGVTVLTKNLTNRARPFTYNSNVPIEERTGPTSRKSFFSGHASHSTAASFYFAKVVTDYHPNMKKGLKIGIWTTMAALPAATAYLRVKAGRHFPTDVIVGYFVGGAIGYFVPQLHKMQARKSSPKVSIVPTIGIDFTSLTMRIRL